MNVCCICEQLIAAMMGATLQMGGCRLKVFSFCFAVGEKSEGLMEGIRQEMASLKH
jgi:hypothetical protein